MTFYIIAEASESPGVHVTLSPAFEISNASSLAGILNSALGFGPFGVTPHEMAVFTSREGEDVSVLKLKLSPALMKLHAILAHAIEGRGGKFVNPSFIRGGFQPHISGSDYDSRLPLFDSLKLSQYSDGNFTTLAQLDLRTHRGNH